MPSSSCWLQQGATVLGTASEQNHDYVRALGATPVRYGEHLIADVIAAAPQGMDAAFDGGARGFVDQALTLVPASRIVTIVDFAAGAKGVQVAGGNPFALTAATIAPVLELAAEGRFATEAAAVLPLDDIAEAHRLSEAGHLRGKILLRVAENDPSARPRSAPDASGPVASCTGGPDAL